MPESRVIVLTGATRGLGRALADAFAAAGHTVLGCGRSPEAVAAVAGALGAPHAFAAVDVSDDAAVAAWARTVLERHGPPDLLVNNAALMNETAPLWEVSADAFARLLAVNLGGIGNTVRHFVPPMIAAGRGVIVNYSSYWGRSVAADVAPYCATKWGVEGLTKALAQDLPPGLAAVAFNPGIIDTDMLRTCFGEGARSYVDPGTWAQAAAPFLLSLGPKHNGKSLTAPGQ
jgi:NAD(P)-dependent dehydrogenase (short-subunit alcohol dehydrogenase family)